MHEDPLVDAQRHNDHQAAHDRLYWQAYGMLQQDFRSAFHEGPRAEVECPYDSPPECELVKLLLDDIEERDLADIITIVGWVCQGSFRDRNACKQHELLAGSVIERMAARHAGYYANKMSESGDLAE